MILILCSFLIPEEKENPLNPMKTFEVDYETTIPPWRFGHEEIEAEDLAAAKKKFCSKYEAARLLKIYMVNTDTLAKWYKEWWSHFNMAFLFIGNGNALYYKDKIW